MSCMRLNIVITSCLSVTFIRLLIRLMEYLLPSRWCHRTGGGIWTPPIEIPLGLRCACRSHFITCLYSLSQPNSSPPTIRFRPTHLPPCPHHPPPDQSGPHPLTPP